MPIAEFRLPDGRIAEFRVPDGTTPEQAQQMIAPMISSLPQAEPGILSQIASLPKEVSKGFIRGLTVDPISGASSLAYTGAQAAGMEGKPFEETGFGKSLGKAQAALAPGQGTISEFGGGVGSMLSFLPGGLLKGGLGLATRLAQTGAVGSEEARQRADQARLQGIDVSAGDKLSAQLGGTAVGFTELAPLERIANPLRAVLRGIPASKADEIAPGLFNSAKRMLATGGVEGLQEGLSNVAQDLIAKGIYNPNLDVGQSALGDAAMGASVGAFAQGAIELLTKGKRTQMYNELKQGEQAKADEERMKGIQEVQEARNKATINPVGFFTAQDLSPDYVDAVNQSRLEQGKVKLNKFSIEDLVESGAHPEEINQLISERTGFDGSAALTPDQVLAVAQEKNIQVDNKGFADFLRRTTGTEDLATMSQPQLHAAFKSLEAAPAFEEPTALQEGSNAVRFTQQDYNSVIGAVKSVMPKEGMITLDQAMNAAAKVKTEEEAKALLKIAADSGDLNAVEKSRYDLVDAEGSVLRSYANRADAERAATQRGLGVQESTSINFAPTAEEVITNEDGTSIRKGTFKQPAGYEIRSDAAVLDVAPTAEEADAKADRMQELREKKAKQLQDQAIKLEEAIAKSNEKLEELKAEGKFESPLFKKAEQDIAKNNQKLQAQIARLNSQSMAFLAPLQVTPRLGRPFKQTGFTVFDQNGNPAATFKTIDEARKQAPAVAKPTVEFQAQADALIKQLRPVMDRLGLAPVRLNIEKAIKTPYGAADGYYLNNLITVALDSPNPMRTLRHEGIHALKELGAFTPDQWRVLENKAKSEWVSKYDIRNRYKHLSEEEMLEEAISDAFSDFDQTKPPAGLIGALFNKIKLFLESLGNALRGRGFTTAEGLFERVEAGEMRISTPAQGKQKLSIAQPTQQVKKRSMEDLEKAIPLKDRVVSKDPTRMVDGKPFSQANISKTGVGFLPLKKYGEEDAQGMINKFWLDSINESGGQYIKNLVDSLGAKPPTVDFINKALSLPELYRYWYEISGETVANLPLPNEIQKTLLDLISATSLLTKPLPNAQRAIGALAEVLQGKPIETDIISLKPVQDALRNPDLETLKFGNFAGTMKYVSGMTDKAPITTNDRQVAFAFDMQANDFAKNPAMYEVVSRFYNKLRDAQNALLPKKAQPYEAWQMQALTWVEQRGDNTSFNTKTSDDYQQAIQAITKILKEEDIPLIDGKISMVTLLDKRVPKILSQTIERFQNALKGTIESNTLLNTEGAEANTEYANLQDIDKPWSKNLQKEFLRIQRRVFEDMSSKGVINDFASAIIGRKINISRIDTTSRGTFEGKLSPNMRVPLVGSLSENKPYALNTEEAEVLLAYLGGSLDQAAMAASVFKPSDVKNADTFRVLIENKKVTDDESTALEKALGYPLNIFESANGSVVEINVGGYDVMPKLPEVSSAFEDVLGDIPMRVIPTSYESIYITKDKGDYSKSYQEIIDAYATSKFGGSESSGIRRKFDANIDRSVLKIREIVETRNKEFGEFTAEAREKLRKYEAQRLKKQAQELKEQAKQVTGGKASLRAPNTPEFKRWFGKSKIVGRDGKPKVMYHGTARDITEFQPKQANAIFLTDDPTFAESFTDLSEDWMVNHSEEFFTPEQIKKFEAEATKIVDKQGYGFVEDELNDLLRANLPTRRNILPVFVKAEDPFDYANPSHIKRLKEWITDFDTLQKISRGSWQTIESPVVQQALEQEGFDSFYVLEGGRKNLAVYKSNQIKSATGNQGTFDINNPNISYSMRDNIDPLTAAAIDRTTTVRPEKGFVERIIGAISPDSMAHFRQAYINKYEAIERQTGQIGKMFGSVELIADTSAIAAALQADRAAGIAAESFKRGVPVFRNGFTSVDDMKGQVKGLIPILEPLAAYKDPFAFRAFQFYAATRRGRRLTAEGREKLFTPDEIRRGQALEAQFPAFKQVFDEYQKYNQGLVKFMKDTGVISDAEAKIWTQNWDYIPFYRQMDGETTAGPKVFSSIAGVGKPKALKGSEEALADFMETVVRNSRAAIESGMKNEAARRVIRDMLRLNQGRLVPAGTSGADIVTMKENGVTKHYQVDDPLLVESLKGLNLPQLPFLEILAMPSNVLRNLVTKDPGFMIANLARDSMQAWVTSGTNLTPLVDTFKQAGKVLAGMSPEAEALAKAGLFGGFDFANDIQSSSRAVEKELRKRSKDFKPQEIAMMPLSKMWELLDKGSTASDVATRAEVYKRVLKETGSEAEAIYQAMEVMNFSRKGNSALIRILSAVVPFLNARIQGLDVLYRSGFGKMATQNREAMQKAFITRSLTILALSSMYWMLASDTDEYKTAEPETRDNYWIFGNVRIPIPFEIGTLFKVFPERILEYFFGQDTGADLKESIIRNITSTLAFNPIPQALLPLVENTANYSFFTGKPIVGMGLEGLEPKFQAGASTSILAQEIGKATNSSPAKIDNLIKGYTGTLGTYAAMMLDSVMRGEGDPTKASMKLEQMPVFKRFFSPSEGTGTISAYYDLKNAVETSTRTINFLERTGNTEDLQQYLMGKGGKLQAIKPYIQTLDKDMTMLRDTRKMVMMSQMEPDAKRAVLDNIRSAEVGLTSRIQSVRKMLEN
jgi:hypothetical protein